MPRVHALEEAIFDMTAAEMPVASGRDEKPLDAIRAGVIVAPWLLQRARYAEVRRASP